MAALYAQQLELGRLPSGIFFASPGQTLPQPLLEQAVQSDVAPGFPTFPKVRNKVAVDAKPVLCLPLMDVTVNVRVDSAIASTRLVQRFTNISADVIPEAHYTFPLYDGVAVTSFRCEIGDSKVLEGQVKPKAEAKQEYQRAIEKMEAAALLEEHTPEVFETMIGNILGNSVVTVEITYVNQLEAELGGEGVLLTIPTSIAPRYGDSPFSGSSNITEIGLRIEVAVNSPYPIKKLESRNHPVSVDIGTTRPPPDALSFGDLAKGKTMEETYDPRKATAHLSERDAHMGKDFVLLIQTSGAPFLRSTAVISPPSLFDPSALMVTIKPSELFTDLPPLDGFDGEIVFLADRSRSMNGTKINTLREALSVFLKSLPETCLFNLFSFGSHFSSLWDTSRKYNQENLDIAMSHVSGFQGDMGGTELLPALEKVVEHRIKDASSTQVILLTDGEVWKTEETIHFVRKTSSIMRDQIRFFALGIGNQVSHRLIQGIGGEGGGFGEVVGVDSQGKWHARVIETLNGALMPKSWTFQIGLGPEYSAKFLDVDDFMEVGCSDKAVPTTELISYIQAPREIPPLHHFSHKSVFFLISSKSTDLPTEVTIKAKAERGLTLTANLPVIPTVEDANAIQHLGVKAALVDLGTCTREDTPQTIARQNAERLGEIYSVSSKWTSFVAVDCATRALNEISIYKAPFTELGMLTNPTYHRTRLRPPRHEPLSSSSSLPVITLGRMMCRERLQADPDMHNQSFIDLSSSPLIDIPWLDIMTSQAAAGTFKFNVALRHKLAQHFCPGTREYMLLLFKRSNNVDQSSEDEETTGDTMMAICYMETHLYQTKNVWDLMIRKAEGAVTKHFLSGQTQAQIQNMLKCSAIHLHYQPYKCQVDHEFPPSKLWDSCLVCGVTPKHPRKVLNPSTAELRCKFAGCWLFFDTWDDLWDHLVSKSHLLCGVAGYASNSKSKGMEVSFGQDSSIDTISSVGKRLRES